MRIHNLVKSNRNVDDLYSEVTKNFDVTLTTEVSELNNAPWSEYSEGALGIDKSWIEARTRNTRELNNDFVDIVALLVDKDDWENGDRGIYGWHLAKQINAYEIIIIKLRGDGTEETIEHEIMHCLDDIVYIHTGYRLEWLLGVEDFDKYVVHALDPRYKYYDFDDVAKEIDPHVKKAIDIKRGKISIGVMGRVLINVRKQLLNIQEKLGYRADRVVENEEDKEALYDVAATVYGEGRGESDEGMRAIANVIKNRQVSVSFPDTYGGVVYQPWQFSVWNPKNGLTEPDGNYNHVMNVLSRDNPERIPGFKRAVDISRSVIDGKVEDNTHGAVNYHNPSVEPEWAVSLIKDGFKRKTIGNHVFYYV